MRLFALRYNKKGGFVKDSNGILVTFTNKEEAKKSRDELNREGGSIVVSYGPDHKKFRGE